MDGYLFDTNIISALANPKDPRNANFTQKVAGLKHVWLPVIAIAEIEFGMAKVDNPNQIQQDEIRKFFQQFPQHLGIGDNTVEPYAQLRAQLWKMHATKNKRRHKEKQPEELCDRTTGKQLGIDERDLLIASIAAENGLILATNDSNPGMTRIEQAAQQLQAAGKPMNLKISYWK
jgi:predicted nucleic acid-binding protein